MFVKVFEKCGNGPFLELRRNGIFIADVLQKHIVPTGLRGMEYIRCYKHIVPTGLKSVSATFSINISYRPDGTITLSNELYVQLNS